MNEFDEEDEEEEEDEDPDNGISKLSLSYPLLSLSLFFNKMSSTFNSTLNSTEFNSP